MRMSMRPGYLVRRSFHFAGISFTVWRRNRATALAFYDPLVDGGFPFLPSVIRRKHVRRLTRILLSGAVLVTIAFAYRHGSDLRAGLDVLVGKAGSLKAESSALSAVPSTSSAPVSPAIPSAPAAPAVRAAPKEPEKAAPASVAEPSEEKEIRFPEDGFYLLACKRDRTLYAYRRQGDRWEKAAAFPMAIGRAPGDKSDAGDLRTPEGRFWITGVVSGTSKGPIYGPLVFTLNYPRPGDEAEGKTGQGIWIHGVEMGKLPSWTHGCLSLANEDIVALSAFADVGTPLLILSDSLAPDPARQMDLAGMQREYPSFINAYGRKTHADTVAKAQALKQAAAYVAKEGREFPELAMQTLSARDKAAILARLQRWREDWSGRKIEAYAENYDPDFRDREGRDRESFLERKGRIFETKSRIQMEIVDPKIEPEGYSRVKVTFRQDYLAEGPQGQQRSSGPKTLRMESGPGGWLIITE
ncbi:MAG TPA: L,D-transpeptidase family protein [Fibrobacteria bacterium]|nr:L,D-transpeptidase family protein [Fibrobacteria bacterium]